MFALKIMDETQKTESVKNIRKRSTDGQHTGLIKATKMDIETYNVRALAKDEQIYELEEILKT